MALPSGSITWILKVSLARLSSNAVYCGLPSSSKMARDKRCLVDANIILPSGKNAGIRSLPCSAVMSLVMIRSKVWLATV